MDVALVKPATERATKELFAAARTAFESVTLADEAARMVRHGRSLPHTTLPGPGPVALFAPDGEFLALYEQRGESARAVAVFV